MTSWLSMLFKHGIIWNEVEIYINLIHEMLYTELHMSSYNFQKLGKLFNMSFHLYWWS